MNRSLIAASWGSLVAFGIPSSALAEVDRVRDLAITWSAPPECPSERDVRTAIAQLLLSAEDRGQRAGPALQFEALVTPAAAQYELRAHVISPTGRELKTLNGATCAMVADAFALVVAFAVDPNLTAAPPTLPRATAEPVAPARSAITLPELPRSTSSAPLPWALGLSVATSVGALPFPGLGFGAAGALGHTPRWELGLSYWLDRPAELALRTGQAVVRVRLFTVRTSACLPLSQMPLEACVAVDGGGIEGAASGPVTHATTGGSWWLSLSAGLAARIPVTGALGLRVRLDAGVPLFRPAFTIDRSNGSSDVWRPHALYGILSIGPEFDFVPRNGSAPAM